MLDVLSEPEASPDQFVKTFLIFLFIYIIVEFILTNTFSNLLYHPLPITSPY
jgi:hypothetical protein